MTTREHPHLATAAPWADEPLGPARRRQVLKACLLAREPLLELHDRAREVWPGHRRTVEPSPDGTGYAQVGLCRELRYAGKFRDRGGGRLRPARNVGITLPRPGHRSRRRLRSANSGRQAAPGTGAGLLPLPARSCDVRMLCETLAKHAIAKAEAVTGCAARPVTGSRLCLSADRPSERVASRLETIAARRSEGGGWPTYRVACSRDLAPASDGAGRDGQRSRVADPQHHGEPERRQALLG